MSERDDVDGESVEVLRERLNTMKRLMAERNISPNEENSSSRPLRPRHPGIIDGNFLSVAFTGALVVIIAVAIYAFYNLYHAILKKFPSHHTEL